MYLYMNQDEISRAAHSKLLRIKGYWGDRVE